MMYEEKVLLAFKLFIDKNYFLCRPD